MQLLNKQTKQANKTSNNNNNEKLIIYRFEFTSVEKVEFKNKQTGHKNIKHIQEKKQYKQINMYILLTFLFLLDVILSVQSTKNSICDSKKAHDVAILACPTRNQIITRITFASFGNPRGDCYSKTLSEDPTCRSEHALEVAESFCVGRSECRVPVMYSLFGETTNCNSEHSLTLKAECGPLSESPESRPMKLKPYEILLVVDGVERKLSFTFHESTSYFDLQNTASNFLENEFGMSHTSVDIVDAVVKQMHVGAYETMGQEIIGNLILGSPQDGTLFSFSHSITHSLNSVTHLHTLNLLSHTA